MYIYTHIHVHIYLCAILCPQAGATPLGAQGRPDAETRSPSRCYYYSYHYIYIYIYT